MNKKRLLAFLLAFAMVMPTIGVSAEELEPTPVSTEISVEKSKAETIIEDAVAQEPKAETIIEDAVAQEPKTETIIEDAVAQEPKAETIIEDVVAEKPKPEAIIEDVVAEEPAIDEISSGLTLMCLEEESFLEPMAAEFSRLDLCEFLLDQAGIEPFDYFYNENEFSDINESQDYYELVMTCQELGWLNGLEWYENDATGAYYFNANSPVYKWELANTLYYVDQGSEEITQKPSDMSSKDWGCYGRVCAVISSGIMSLSNGKFYPNNVAKLSDINTNKWKNNTPFTRGSFCAFLVDELNLSVESTNWPDPEYSDLRNGSKYYDEIMTCYHLGILENGINDSRFHANSGIERRMAAEILYAAQQGSSTLAPTPRDVQSDRDEAVEIRSVLQAGVLSLAPDAGFDPWDMLTVADINTDKMVPMEKEVLTWGDFVKFLVEENGLSDFDTSDIRNENDNLSKSDSCYNEALICQELDWVNDEFWPYDAMTREDLAIALYEANQYGEKADRKDLPMDLLDRYSGSWLNYISSVFGAGLMTATQHNEFNGQAPAYLSDINMDGFVPSGMPLTVASLCELLVEKLNVPIPTTEWPTSPFENISKSDPDYDVIAACYYLGWLDDIGTWNLKASAPLRSHEMAMILFAADQGGAASGGITPNSLSKSNSYYSEICALLNSGVLSLDSDNRFSNNEYCFLNEIDLSKLKAYEKGITQGEFLNLFVKAIGAENLNFSDIEDHYTFTYVPKGHDCYDAAMICKKMNCLYFGNDFWPDEVMSKEDAAYFLYNANQGSGTITVKAKDINNNNINHILSAGIMTTDENGHFNPDAPVKLSDINMDAILPSGATLTRAAVCELLVDALNVADMNVSGLKLPYTDVSEADSFYRAVLIAYNFGWLKDWTVYSNKFEPAAMIDGEELADILYNAGQGGEPTSRPPSNISPSNDSYKKVCALLGSGVISLDEDNEFSLWENVYPSAINTAALKPLSTTESGTKALQLDLSDGSILIESGYSGITYTQNGITVSNTKGAVIKQTDAATATANTITVNGKDSFGSIPVKLTIAGLNVASDEPPIKLEGFANVELSLFAENNLLCTGDPYDIYGGIEVPANAALTIGGSGSLSVTTTRSYIATIGHGGNCGKITINNGTIHATSYSGVSIGGKNADIIINGGNIHAEQDYYNEYDVSDDIGGNNAQITINNGTVSTAVVIGGYKSSISIKGGSVTTWFIGRTDSVVSISDATVKADRIGGSLGWNCGGDCAAITIKNAAVTPVTEGTEVEYHEKITINKQPATATALHNDLVFSVDAYGHSGLSYQWESSTDNSTWTAMEGETATTLITPLAEGTYYRCKLTNGWGNSVYTDSTQGFKLAFRQQPQDIETPPEGLVGLSVAAENSNVTYQWQKSLNGLDWQNLEGERSSSLILDADIDENGAYYRCIIKATNGEILASDAALITISTTTPTYKTEYYLEQTDGTYRLVEQTVKEGAYGDTVTAEKNAFKYFDENMKKGTHSGTITAGEQLVLSRYYDRSEYTIVFHENGGVDLADITAKYDAPITAPANPSRYGYVFSGWYSDEALTTPYTFTTMPGGGASLYAKWDILGAGRGIEYSFNSISVFDSETHKKLYSIPKDVFEMEVSVENLSSKTTDTLMVAAYDSNGQMIDLHYMYSNTAEGNTSVLGITVDNRDGSIAYIKAFMVPILNGQTPLAKSIRFGE